MTLEPDRIFHINDLILCLYRDIRDAHLWGMSYGEISTRLGMPRSTVQKICSGHDPRFTVRPAEEPDTDWRFTIQNADGTTRECVVPNRSFPDDDDRVAFVMSDGTVRTERVADAMLDTNGLARHLKTLSEIFDQLEANPFGADIQDRPWVDIDTLGEIYDEPEATPGLDNDHEQE